MAAIAAEAGLNAAVVGLEQRKESEKTEQKKAFEKEVEQTFSFVGEVGHCCLDSSLPRESDIAIRNVFVLKARMQVSEVQRGIKLLCSFLDRICLFTKLFIIYCYFSTMMKVLGPSFAIKIFKVLSMSALPNIVFQQLTDHMVTPQRLLNLATILSQLTPTVWVSGESHFREECSNEHWLRF